MRTIKFSYILQHDETGRIIDKRYNIEDIENFEFRDEPHGYTLVVRRQFTGLLDKNGVEVFEGDIFYDDWDNHIGVVKFFNGIYFTESYKDINEILEPCDNREYLISRLQRDCGSCLKVIGNIYEHPHLLEANHD